MFILCNSMCFAPFRIDNLIYIGCNDFHHLFLEPSPLSSGQSIPLLFPNLRRIRRPKDWYICASHFPGWYFNWYQYKHHLILAKIFHHGWRKFWIFTSLICFKLPFGNAFPKSVFMSNIDFLYQKTLDPLFLKPSPFVLPYPFEWAFSSLTFLGYFERANSPINKGGLNKDYGIPRKAPRGSGYRGTERCKGVGAFRGIP